MENQYLGEEQCYKFISQFNFEKETTKYAIVRCEKETTKYAVDVIKIFFKYYEMFFLDADL